MTEFSISAPTFSQLLKDLFTVDCQYCSSQETLPEMPFHFPLFSRRQLMSSEKLQATLQSMHDQQILIVVDRIFVTWLFARQHDTFLLIGPFRAFSVSPLVLRRCLVDIGEHVESLTEFQKYEDKLPDIRDDRLASLIKITGGVVLEKTNPEVQWIRLFSEDANRLPAEKELNAYVESAYEEESSYLEAIYAGNTRKALDVLHNIQNRYRRNPSKAGAGLLPSIYGNAINCTMARIAAFQAGVSPLILDTLFQEFMVLSLNGKTIEDQYSLTFRMTALVCEQVQQVKTIGYDPLIRTAICYLLENFHKEIYLETVADYVGVHKNYLSSLFKEETGSTFSGYLTDLRLKQAEIKLKLSTDEIGHIAQSCGFSDQNYFARVFRKKHGVSPTQYRRMQNRI